MTIDSRSVSCTWIHWCPIVYPLSVISFVLKTHSGEPKETRKTYHAEHDNCLDFILYVQLPSILGPHFLTPAHG